uniref:Uncharacterized protein n=1 Tax=Cajanus cajan TaxID=3821 RepID=A0A151T2L6_CAJCA|nr:hypothetical protein KK1_023698 [Cajanus cajan]
MYWGLGVKNTVDFNITFLAKWRFWLDNWACLECLALHHPRMFLDSKQKHDSIASMEK